MVCNAFFEFVCVARKMYFLFLTLDKLSRFYAHFVLRFIHLLAEELGDALQVRGLAAAGAGAAELEQGLCELAVTQYSYCLRIMKVGFLLLLFVCIV